MKAFENPFEDPIHSLFNLLSSPEIELTHHSIKRLNKRNMTKKIIANVISDDKLVGLQKQDSNKFKIYYEHPTKTGYDLIIVITIPYPDKKNYTIDNRI